MKKIGKKTRKLGKRHRLSLSQYFNYYHYAIYKCAYHDHFEHKSTGVLIVLNIYKGIISVFQ